MATLPAHPRIPYGEANFQRIRLNRWLYVDKTRVRQRYADAAFQRRLAEFRHGLSGLTDDTFRGEVTDRTGREATPLSADADGRASPAPSRSTPIVETGGTATT